MRLFNFIRIACASIALLQWLAFMWVSDYVGNAAALAAEPWREAGKL